MYHLSNDNTVTLAHPALLPSYTSPERYGQDNPVPRTGAYPLRDAVKLFQKSYIPAVARYAGVPGMKNLSKVLQYDRSELSDRVYHGLRIELPVSHEQALAGYSSSLEDYLRTPGIPLIDSLASRVFAEAIETNDYGLKKQTDRFKEFYVTAVVREHAGEVMRKTAAKILGLNPKTVKHWIGRYYRNLNNYLTLVDDSPKASSPDSAPKNGPDALSSWQGSEKIA